MRHGWALRDDLPIDLLLERLAVETDDGTLAALAAQTDATPHIHKLICHPSPLVVVAASLHPAADDANAAHELERLLATRTGRAAVSRHVRRRARRGELDNRPRTLTALLAGGHTAILRLLLPYAHTEDHHRTIAHRLAGHTGSRNEVTPNATGTGDATGATGTDDAPALTLELLATWPANTEAIQTLTGSSRWATHVEVDPHLQAWHRPTRVRMRALYADEGARETLATLARHTRHLPLQERLLELLDHLWGLATPQADETAAEVADALVENDWLDPDLRTVLLSADLNLMLAWREHLKRATLTEDTAALAWRAAESLDDAAFERRVVRAARDRAALLALEAAGAPDRLLVAHPDADLELALWTAPASAALAGYPRPLELLDWIHATVRDATRDAGSRSGTSPTEAHVLDLLDRLLDGYTGPLGDLGTLIDALT